MENNKNLNSNIFDYLLEKNLDVEKIKEIVANDINVLMQPNKDGDSPLLFFLKNAPKLRQKIVKEKKKEFDSRFERIVGILIGNDSPLYQRDSKGRFPVEIFIDTGGTNTILIKKLLGEDREKIDDVVRLRILKNFFFGIRKGEISNKDDKMDKILKKREELKKLELEYDSCPTKDEKNKKEKMIIEKEDEIEKERKTMNEELKENFYKNRQKLRGFEKSRELILNEDEKADEGELQLFNEIKSEYKEKAKNEKKEKSMKVENSIKEIQQKIKRLEREVKIINVSIADNVAKNVTDNEIAVYFHKMQYYHPQSAYKYITDGDRWDELYGRMAGHFGAAISLDRIKKVVEDVYKSAKNNYKFCYDDIDCMEYEDEYFDKKKNVDYSKYELTMEELNKINRELFEEREHCEKSIAFLQKMIRKYKEKVDYISKQISNIDKNEHFGEQEALIDERLRDYILNKPANRDAVEIANIIKQRRYKYNRDSIKKRINNERIISMLANNNKCLYTYEFLRYYLDECNRIGVEINKNFLKGILSNEITQNDINKQDFPVEKWKLLRRMFETNIISNNEEYKKDLNIKNLHQDIKDISKCFDENINVLEVKPIIEDFIDSDGEIIIKDGVKDKDGNTALHIFFKDEKLVTKALKSGKFDYILTKLIDSSANLIVKDEGDIPLFYYLKYAKNFTQENLELLCGNIRKEELFSIRNNKGFNAMDILVSRGDVKFEKIVSIMGILYKKLGGDIDDNLIRSINKSIENSSQNLNNAIKEMNLVFPINKRNSKNYELGDK